MLIPWLSLLGGFVVLTGGADGLVRGSSALARRFGMSPLMIGLTVVAIGTSMPELMVSLDAALRGSSEVALGNVIGSNISNVGLILGLSALVATLKVKAQVVRFDAPVLVGVSLLLGGLLADGTLTRYDGGVLVVVLIGYVFFTIYAARAEKGPAVRAEFDEGVPEPKTLTVDLLFLGGGLAALVLGARFLVGGAITIAEAWGVSEAVIGLTLVAVGTSLPELATSAVAAYRNEGDIAVGNAVGSSIFNILGILGITVLVEPLGAGGISVVDGLVMIGMAVLVLPFMRTGFALNRWEGGALLLAYGSYLFYLIA